MIFAQKLREHPAGIRNAARGLAEVIREQAEEWKARKPNDPEDLARHDELVAFFERIAAELGKLADAIDEAIAAGEEGSPEPVLLGKAGKIARQLNIGFMEWLEENRKHLAGYTLRVGVLLAGFSFLHACGVGDTAATIASSLVNASFPRAKATTAQKHKDHEH